MKENQDPNNHKKVVADFFRKQDKRRLVVGFLFTLLALLVLFRAFTIMFVEGNRWRAEAQKIRKPIEVEVLPARGNIYAASGELLSATSPTFTLFLDGKSEPIRVLKEKHPDSLSLLLGDMAHLLSNEFRLNARTLLSSWNKAIASGDRDAPLLSKPVPYAEYKELIRQYPFVVLNAKGKKVPSALLRSIVKVEKPERKNPFGDLANRTIGTVENYPDKKGIAHGKYGLELGYDSLLTGRPGTAIRRFMGGRSTTNITKPAQRGYDIYTTLNMDFQLLADQVLREQLSTFRAAYGTAIVMETKTGRILSIANLHRTSAGTYVDSINFAISGLVEPGSTFKTPIMMAALEDGVINPDDPLETGNGVYPVAGRRSPIRDHNAHRGGYGTITAKEAIWFSSNVGMVKIAQRGYSQEPARLYNRLRQYGFQTDLKLPIPGYAKSGTMPNPNNKNFSVANDLASTSFGYAVKIPPIYTLNFYNAIANGGKLMRPYLVDKVVDAATGEVIMEHKPQVLNDSICSPWVLSQIQDMLRNVVLRGTGKPAHTPIVEIAGKSGTANIYASGAYQTGRHFASFCGYFPADDPQYTCFVGAYDTYSNSGGLVGGQGVKRIAEGIMSRTYPIRLDTLPDLSPAARFAQVDLIGGEFGEVAAFSGAHHLSLTHSGVQNDAPVLIRRQENGYVAKAVARTSDKVMPDLIGCDPATAVYVLMSKGVMVRMMGMGVVVAQSVPMGNTVAPGAMVTLTLGLP